MLMLERSFSGMLLLCAHALNSQHGVLRTAIPLFLDSELLLPQTREKRVALLDGVEAEALGIVQLMPVRVFLQQALHPPFDVCWRLLGTATEKDVVLNLETTNIVIQGC